LKRYIEFKNIRRKARTVTSIFLENIILDCIVSIAGGGGVSLGIFK
jgi:hypoxanthine phosphoribosyltransferase